MTRDEAVRYAEHTIGDRNLAGKFVAMAVALGMLKLDEPKHEIVPVKAQNMLHYRFGHKEAERLLEDLDAHGLKIVEK
jgi:hypothetical protein